MTNQTLNLVRPRSHPLTLDLDGDGIETVAASTNLRIWQDADNNGVTSAGELNTLAELGIASINTGYTNSALVEAHGNEHKQVGSYAKADGTTATATDVWSKQDKMYSVAKEWLDIPADIAALPDLRVTTMPLAAFFSA